MYINWRQINRNKSLTNISKKMYPVKFNIALKFYYFVNLDAFKCCEILFLTLSIAVAVESIRKLFMFIL